MINLISWQDLTPSERVTVHNFQVTQTQVDYAGPVSRAIAAVEANQSGEVMGIALQFDEAIVGFVVLKCGSMAPTWASQETIFISALRIDHQYQGRGLGTMALQAIPNWIKCRWHGYNNIKLSVDEDNVSGIRAYEKACFKDEGIREAGRIGWVRYMSRSIYTETDDGVC